jgi:prepilin-type N-terminal cleavage/methylation domain-containing protein
MNRIRRRRRNAQAGFALLEILVATAIAALSLTILYGLIASSTRGARSEQAMVEASLVGQSLLAEVATGARTIPGEYWSEADADPRWRLRLTPAENAQEGSSRAFLSVDVTIWPFGADKAPIDLATEVSVHEPPSFP